MSSIDLTNMDINEIVQSYLAENDIDVEPEVVAQILSSPEIKEHNKSLQDSLSSPFDENICDKIEIISFLFCSIFYLRFF